ncbi:hypothetical protein RAHE111665_06010 [Rariglobus hedericola]
MGDHRQRAVFDVAVVDVALPGFRRAVGVGKILVQVLAEMIAPDQVSAEIAVGERDRVDGFVGEQDQGDDHGLVALTAGDGALDQALAKEVEDAVVAGAGEVHPRIDTQEGGGRIELGGVEVALGEDGRRCGKGHV